MSKNIRIHKFTHESAKISCMILFFCSQYIVSIAISLLLIYMHLSSKAKIPTITLTSLGK